MLRAWLTLPPAQALCSYNTQCQNRNSHVPTSKLYHSCSRAHRAPKGSCVNLTLKSAIWEHGHNTAPLTRPVPWICYNINTAVHRMTTNPRSVSQANIAPANLATRQNLSRKIAHLANIASWAPRSRSTAGRCHIAAISLSILFSLAVWW